MDFLRGKVVSLDVTDLGIRYRLMCDDDGFKPAAPRVEPPMCGSVVRPTRFCCWQPSAKMPIRCSFSACCCIEGDTAAGLHLKNFLVPLASHHCRARRGMSRTLHRSLWTAVWCHGSGSPTRPRRTRAVGNRASRRSCPPGNRPGWPPADFCDRGLWCRIPRSSHSKATTVPRCGGRARKRLRNRNS